MLIDAIVDPWTWGDWMWRGVLTASLVAISCAVLGVFLYLRRMSLISDALAHVALPGIVAAFLLTGSVDGPTMLAGAAAVGLLASMAIEGLARHPRVRPDAAIGIVFTTFFAVGVIALSTLVHDAHIDTDCVLFGNVLGVSDESIMMLAVVTPAVVLGCLIFYRWLAAATFDSTLAISVGVPVSLVHYGLMTAVSVTTVASFEAVGAILVIAMIIVPAATAHLLASRLSTMIAIAVAHGLLSAVTGMYVSVYLNCSSAGAIVVVSGALYALVRAFAPRFGLVTRMLRRGTPAARAPERIVTTDRLAEISGQAPLVEEG